MRPRPRRARRITRLMLLSSCITFPLTAYKLQHLHDGRSSPSAAQSARLVACDAERGMITAHGTITNNLNTTADVVVTVRFYGSGGDEIAEPATATINDLGARSTKEFFVERGSLMSGTIVCQAEARAQ